MYEGLGPRPGVRVGGEPAPAGPARALTLGRAGQRQQDGATSSTDQGVHERKNAISPRSAHTFTFPSGCKAAGVSEEKVEGGGHQNGKWHLPVSQPPALGLFAEGGTGDRPHPMSEIHQRCQMQGHAVFPRLGSVLRGTWRPFTIPVGPDDDIPRFSANVHLAGHLDLTESRHN